MIEKLNNNNYHTWKFWVKMLLIERDLWEIVNRSEQAPEDLSEVESSTKARASAEAATKWARTTGRPSWPLVK